MMKTKLSGKHIPLELIKGNIKNPRKNTYDRRDIEDLKDSLSTIGQITNIKVHKDGKFYTILAGHRRFMCAKELKLPTLKADIYEKLSPFQQSSILFSDNTTQKRFNAWEMRKAISDTYWNEFVEEYEFKGEHDKGFGEFSKQIGISTTQVSTIIQSTEKNNEEIIRKVQGAGLGVEIVDYIIKSPKSDRKRLTNRALELKDRGTLKRVRDELILEKVKIRTEEKEHLDELPVAFFTMIILACNKIVNSLSKNIVKKLSAEQKDKLKIELHKINNIGKWLK